MFELAVTPEGIRINSPGAFGKFAVAGMLAASLTAPEALPPALPTIHTAVAQAEFALPPTDRTECVAPSPTDFKSALDLVREPTPTTL